MWIPISRNLDIPDNSKQRSFPFLIKHFIFILSFSNSPISRSNFRFIWRIEKSELHCVKIMQVTCYAKDTSLTVKPFNPALCTQTNTSRKVIWPPKMCRRRQKTMIVLQRKAFYTFFHSTDQFVLYNLINKHAEIQNPGRLFFRNLLLTISQAYCTIIYCNNILTKSYSHQDKGSQYIPTKWQHSWKSQV